MNQGGGRAVEWVLVEMDWRGLSVVNRRSGLRGGLRRTDIGSASSGGTEAAVASGSCGVCRSGVLVAKPGRRVISGLLGGGPA